MDDKENNHVEINIPFFGERMKDTLLGPITMFALLFNYKAVIGVLFGEGVEQRIAAVKAASELSLLYAVIAGAVFSFVYPMMREGFVGVRSRILRMIREWSELDQFAILEDRELRRFFFFWALYYAKNLANTTHPNGASDEQKWSCALLTLETAPALIKAPAYKLKMLLVAIKQSEHTDAQRLIREMGLKREAMDYTSTLFQEVKKRWENTYKDPRYKMPL